MTPGVGGDDPLEEVVEDCVANTGGDLRLLLLLLSCCLGLCCLLL